MGDEGSPLLQIFCQVEKIKHIQKYKIWGFHGLKIQALHGITTQKTLTCTFIDFIITDAHVKKRIYEYSVLTFYNIWLL